MDKSMDIRPSPIAGQWYPSNSNRLAVNVDGYIDAAELPELDGEVVAVIAPHAGHIYSGPVAGYAFAALRGLNPDLVAVVSPMHYAYPSALLTSAHHAYETPLGAILIDQTMLDNLDRKLKEELGFGLTRIRSDPEHSLEIELPFLQRILKEGFRILPVMVRDVNPRVTRSGTRLKNPTGMECHPGSKH
jgi:AmmeMemoRadiSam system protein B